MLSLLLLFLVFVIVSIASREIGHFLGRFSIPHITGYLFVGLLVGPFVLNIMPSGSTEQLRFIDELSLAVIAFIAGSELYFKELRSRLRPILLNAAGIVVAALLFISAAIFVLTEFLPFTTDLSVTARIAVALLGGTILLALSPASTIAVIQEARAKGPFTKTVLSITVVMDVVIIVLFAVSVALAGVLLTDNTLDVGFVGLLAVDLLLALGIGVLVGMLLNAVLSTSWHFFIKIALVLAIGFGIFFGGFELTYRSREWFNFELHVEPLLAAMIAGFYVTNFTQHRHQFEEILQRVAPAIYVAFFTLTGVALKLDILLASFAFAAILFLVRVFSIFVGSFAGGTLAGEPMRFRKIMWLGLVTQAGIALGLAREVAVEFPGTMGDSFATLIISVVVLNEVFGPLLLKYALRRAGESNEPGQSQADGQRYALILGIEGQTVALARELKANGWQVMMADTDASHVEMMAAEDVEEQHIDKVDEPTLRRLVSNTTDALVTMLDDDNANLEALEIGRKLGVQRLIVQPNATDFRERLNGLEAVVVDPSTAMVNLLDQLVRAPQSAALLMHEDPTYDIEQITITDEELDGRLVRDLRLPPDVLILEITRNGHSVLPRGYTSLHCMDDVVLVGKRESLQEARLKLGY